MVTEVLTSVGALLAIGSVAYVGYCVGRHSGDEDDLRSAETYEKARSEAYDNGFQDGHAEGQAASDTLFAGDWDRGYNTGLEAGRATADPATISYAISTVREARWRWLQTQTEDYLTSYRELFWRIIAVARNIGERYRKVESLGQGGLIPIGDALNVCVYVADVIKQYEDNRILTRPHQGVFEGKAS